MDNQTSLEYIIENEDFIQRFAAGKLLLFVYAFNSIVLSRTDLLQI